MRELLTIMLRKEGYDVVAVGGRAAAATQLSRGSVELIITDVKLPDGDGIEILRHVKAAAPDTIVIVMTAFGSTEMAVAAMKLGAQDYLTKPFDIEELKIVVRNALKVQQLQQENLLLRTEFQSQHGLESITGASPPMLEVFKMVRSIAPTGSTVLITGESGTGKELIAKAVHALSPRSEAPFISINCGALPEGLLESELFGHVKGAFTDAHQNKKGLFEAAHRGTLFLDEVGDMNPSAQAKVLRVLQEGELERVGGNDTIKVDVRVIAATNKDLQAEIAAQRFREDLYYRLAVVPIELPPLRARREDVPGLVDHLLELVCASNERKPKRVVAGAMTLLMQHDWPGNVRELKNVVERLVILTGDADQIAESDVLEALPRVKSVKGGFARGTPFKDLVAASERDIILAALEANDHHVSNTARELQLERSHLYKKMRALGIDHRADEAD
jgi:DNA-binding NtrC family response regulator